MSVAPGGPLGLADCIPCDLVQKLIIPICLVHNKRVVTKAGLGVQTGLTIPEIPLQPVSGLLSAVEGGEGLRPEIMNAALCEDRGWTTSKRTSVYDNDIGPTKKRKTQSGSSVLGQGEMICFAKAQPVVPTVAVEARSVAKRKGVQVTKNTDKSKGSDGCPKTTTGPQ